MAHQSNVIQVGQKFESKASLDKVTDPNCGKEISKRSARSVLFRDGDTLYFCSRECREEFQRPKKKKAA